MDSPFFILTDNRVSYSYIFDAASPGNPGKQAKQVFSFTHFDIYKYGTNFFTISLFKSDKGAPAGPCPVFGVGCSGNTEIYGLFRSTVGFNEIFNTRAFSIGPLRNVSFEFGGDANTQNDFVGAAKRDVVAGLQFAFDLPYKGFFNVAPLYYKEFSNHNGFLQCGFAPAGACLPDGNTRFKGTYAVETNYYMDLGFLPEYLPFSISGRAAIYGPKGSSNAPLVGPASKLEFNSEPIRLTLDASRAIWGPKYSHYVDLWVAYRYWQNKFGLDHKANPVCTGANRGSCTESSLYSGVTVKF